MVAMVQGLEDYWEKMWHDPLSAGGFLWDFADNAVVRKDMNDSLIQISIVQQMEYSVRIMKRKEAIMLLKKYGVRFILNGKKLHRCI